MFNLMNNTELVSGLSLPCNIQGALTSLKSGHSYKPIGLVILMTEY